MRTPCALAVVAAYMLVWLEQRRRPWFPVLATHESAIEVDARH